MTKIIRMKSQIISKCSECLFSFTEIESYGFLKLQTRRNFVCTAHTNQENGKYMPVSKDSIPEWCELEEYTENK